MYVLQIFVCPFVLFLLAIVLSVLLRYTNSVISHERGKDREVLTTSGTYPWSFGTQLFRSGQPSHGGDRKIVEVMTSKWVEPCLLQILGNQTEKNKSSK
jgi:hypothetical protein